MNPLQAIQQLVQKAVSEGVNASLETLLADLRGNSPVKSGSMAGGWSVKEPASLLNWQGTITNTQFYARWQYPYRLYKEPNAKYPTAYPAPSLFSPKPNGLTGGYGVLEPEDVSLKHGEVLRQTIEDSLAKAFK